MWILTNEADHIVEGDRLVREYAVLIKEKIKIYKEHGLAQIEKMLDRSRIPERIRKPETNPTGKYQPTTECNALCFNGLFFEIGDIDTIPVYVECGTEIKEKYFQTIETYFNCFENAITSDCLFNYIIS